MDSATSQEETLATLTSCLSKAPCWKWVTSFLIELHENSSYLCRIRKIKLRTIPGWGVSEPVHWVGDKGGQGDKHVLRHEAGLHAGFEKPHVGGVVPVLRKHKLGQE